MIAECRHAGGDHGDAVVESAGHQGLAATLAVADHDEHFAVPLGPRSEEVDGPRQAEKHPAEIDRIAALASFVPIVLQAPGGQLAVELGRLAVGDSVSVQVHRQHPRQGPFHRVGHHGAADSGAVDPEDGRKGPGSGILGHGQITRDGRPAQARNLHVETRDLGVGLLDRRELRLEGHLGQLLFLVGPERVEVVGHRQAGPDLQR